MEQHRLIVCALILFAFSLHNKAVVAVYNDQNSSREELLMATSTAPIPGSNADDMQQMLDYLSKTVPRDDTGSDKSLPLLLTPCITLPTYILECALLTDGRFSGGSHGFVVGHICPEAQEGGPIGLIQTGDQITIDVAKRRIDVNLTEEQLEERRRRWTPPPYKANRGVLYKYIRNVQPASEGCVTDE